MSAINLDSYRGNHLNSPHHWKTCQHFQFLPNNWCRNLQYVDQLSSTFNFWSKINVQQLIYSKAPYRRASFPWQVSWRVYVRVCTTNKLSLTNFPWQGLFVPVYGKFDNIFSWQLLRGRMNYVRKQTIPLSSVPCCTYTRASFLAEKLVRLPFQGKIVNFLRTHEQIKLGKENLLVCAGLNYTRYRCYLSIR